MKLTDTCAHLIPGYGDLDQRRRAVLLVETIQENFALARSVECANYNLVRSPGHYNAIINPNARQIGIGIEVIENSVLVVQHFANQPATYADDESFIASFIKKINALRSNAITRADSLPDKYAIIIRDIRVQGPDYRKIAELIFSSKQCCSFLKNSQIECLYVNELRQGIDGIHFTFTLFGKGSSAKE